MRGRIAWLVAATTSAVILAFVVPLCLLVRQVAQDRAMASAEQETRNVAVLVSGLDDDPSLPELVAEVDDRSAPRTSVVRPDGVVLGAPLEGAQVEQQIQEAQVDAMASTRVDRDGGTVLVPVVTGSGTWVVRSWLPRAELDGGVLTAWLAIGTLGASLMLASVVVAWWLGRRISTPLVDLAGVAARFGRGDLEVRARAVGAREVASLADAFNAMAERLGELLRSERTRVADLSHRLRTPVTALRLDVEAIVDPSVGARLREHVDQLQRSIDGIVHEAKRPLHRPLAHEVDATSAVHERVLFWRALAEDQGRPVGVTLPGGPLRVPLDRDTVHEIVDILVDNVFAHTQEAVGFRVSLDRDQGTARLEVADDGAGVSATTEPEVGSGRSGLGLQSLRRAVARAGGDVSVTSGSSGTTVTVRLPLAPR